MTSCPFCGYSDPGTPAVCPRCARALAPTGAPASGLPGQPYGVHGQGAGSAPAAPYGSAVSATGAPAGYGSPPGPVAGAPLPAPRLPSSSENPYAPPMIGAAPPPYAYAYAFAPDVPNSGWSIASMVIGILSIILYPAGLVTGTLAIVFWYLARRQISQQPPTHKGMGMAVAGLVTGIIGAFLGLLFVIGVAAFTGAFHGAS
jgi:hypothetical protein